MNINRINEIKAKIDKVSRLAEEIKELDTLCRAIVSEDHLISIDIKSENLSKKNDLENKIEFDEYGFIKDNSKPKSYSLSSFSYLNSIVDEAEKISKAVQYTTFNKIQCGSKLAIELFGTIIGFKTRQRESIINELKELGVTI